MNKLTKSQGIKQIKALNTSWQVSTPNLNHNSAALGVPLKTTEQIVEQIKSFWNAKDCYIASNGKAMTVKISGDYYQAI